MKHLLTALTLLILPIYPALAQEASPSPASSPSLAPIVSPADGKAAPEQQKFFLTLTQAIEIAESQNHDILLAQEKILDARLQITEAGAQGLPQLSAAASYGRQDPILSQQSVDTNAGGAGNALGNNPQFAALLGTASVNTFSTNVTLNQVLFSGFRVIDGIRLAQINVEGQMQGLRQTRQNVIYQVTNAYFNALRAFEVVAVDKESIDQIREQVRVAEVKLKAGAGLKLDVLQAQSQEIQLQQRLSQDLNAYAKAKMSLNQVMGRESDYPMELNTVATVAEYGGDPAKNLEVALENRSDLRQLKLQKEISEINATIQGRAVWPTLSAQVRYSLQDNAVVGGNNRSVQNMNYGLNLNWPIFDGFSAQAKAQRAMQQAEQAGISFDQAQQRVILEIQQSLLDLQEAKEREQMAKTGIQVSEESLRIARVSYREGAGLMLNVLTAQSNLQQARNALISARFDMNVRKARLYQTLGLDILDQLR